MSEAEELYQHKLLRGIISECYALDYDVAIFSTFIKDTGLPEYKIGEKNIYNLINFDHFDGILVAGQTLAMKNLPQNIENLLLHKCGCPVLYIDQTSGHFPFIYTNDRKASEQITDHLIDCHGYQNIFCLAAYPASISTISRVAGFKDSLQKHGIAIDESRISYEGDFYFTGGERLADKIANGGIERPEAVVCISDYMAIGLINGLAEHGIRVPEDIAVTGYDATDEAATCSTVITTYSPPIRQTGVDAVCELTRLMTGQRPEPCNVKSSRLDIGHSCGCNDIDFMKRSGILRLKEKSEDYKRLLDSYMMESLTAVTDFEDCIAHFCYYLYLIKDYSDYYLCLCDNWDGSADNYSPEHDQKLQTGYTDKMTLVLAREDKEFVGSNITFDVKDMLPDLWKDREKPKAYYFTPLHFNENTIGYSALTYGDKIEAFDITYRNWSRNVMNVLEFHRTHQKLYRSSFRDVLTGIYNRRGLDQLLPELIGEVRSQNKKLCVLMADLDNLKAINDRYGHKEGDNVLIIVANAFQSCCRNNDLCAKIGGDEFLVVGPDEKNNCFADFVKSVKQYIEDYNRTSKKPYRIEISMGVYCSYIKENTSIDIMIDCADHEMYVNKAINKKRRKEY